jgi:hypothetical protein
MLRSPEEKLQMNTLADKLTCSSDPSQGSWEFKQKAPAALSNTKPGNRKLTLGTNGTPGNKEAARYLEYSPVSSCLIIPFQGKDRFKSHYIESICGMTGCFSVLCQLK